MCMRFILRMFNFASQPSALIANSSDSGSEPEYNEPLLVPPNTPSSPPNLIDYDSQSSVESLRDVNRAG